VSRKLFEAVRAHMVCIIPTLFIIPSNLIKVVASIQKSREIEDFPDPLGWCCDDGMDLNAANRLTVLSMPLPGLRARSTKLVSGERTSASIMEMIEVIEQAKQVDRNLEEWCNGLSDVWRGEVSKVVTEEPKDVMHAFFWPGPQFVYQDLNIAHIITDYRICRIFCQAIIRECVNALPTSAHSEGLRRTFTEAIYISQQMVNDFSSSVPYHVGFGMESRADCITPADQRCKHTFPSMPITLLTQESAAMATGAYFSAAPLYICKSISCIPARQRQWLLGRLIYIGKRHGHVEESVAKQYSVIPRTVSTTPLTPISPLSSNSFHHFSPTMMPSASQYSLESYA
jgi:hypothetical protein